MLLHTSVQTPVGEGFTYGSLAAILSEEINYKVCLSLQEAALTCYFPTWFLTECYSKPGAAVPPPFLDEKTEALGPLPSSHREAFSVLPLTPLPCC